jgi:aminopeptidase N
MLHELAHQWFGNSVAPTQWSDVWQNEGHATWYEVTYQLDPDSPEFTEQARQVYALGDLFRFLFGPVASPKSGAPTDVFNPNVYTGGALTLYALRQQVGDATFRRIERAWVTKYRGRSASTADFIALASQVSGQDLTAFLTDWLYGLTTPAMPGHPDWTVDPAPPGASVAAQAAPWQPSFGLHGLQPMASHKH